MTRTRPNVTTWVRGLMLLTAGGFCFVSLAFADAVKDPGVQQDKQKQIQADTDRMVRRMETMVRVLVYNQLDKATETKMLEEVAGTLSGLSKQQMTDVINRLGSVQKAGDEVKTQAELDAAYGRHR